MSQLVSFCRLVKGDDSGHLTMGRHQEHPKDAKELQLRWIGSDLFVAFWSHCEGT